MNALEKSLVAAVSDRRKSAHSGFGSAVRDRRYRRESGAALMLSLWALFLLSAMLISWAIDIDSRLVISGQANRALEAEAMACSGAEIAMHPAVLPGSPLLHGGLARNQTYETRITGEGGRLNINWIVAQENPQRLEVLRKYLENKGVDLNERDHMIDCLLDWVDPDNLVRLNGAEDEPGYKPANRGRLLSIDELKNVRGWAEFTSQKDWDADFTLKSTGQIDVRWASRDVLLALPGMDANRVEQFLALRRGADGIEGTEDDPIKQVDDFRIALGFTPEQFAPINALVWVNDPVLRVTSVGKSGDVMRVVRMVIRKQGNSVQLLTWKEL
jgi:general secretion pathway protein K